MKGKIIVAGTHTLFAQWERAHLIISEGSTVLFDGKVFNDILDFEDIMIAANGDASFVVRTFMNTETASDYSSDSYEPKMKYPFKTKVQVLDLRTKTKLVTLA